MSVKRPATIREAYVEASSFLQRSGVREPEANARSLLEHLLGESRDGRCCAGRSRSRRSGRRTGDGSWNARRAASRCSIL
ncbi:hypothetical protein LJK88_00190 [Paenibacillus sp. P26]|nr:hypothetical protein LJK88_00190 [Paenibacillus sp. P26]